MVWGAEPDPIHNNVGLSAKKVVPLANATSKNVGPARASLYRLIVKVLGRL